MILYVGDMRMHTNARGRYETIRQLGGRIVSVDTSPLFRNPILRQMHHHLNFGPGIYRLNQEVRKIADRNYLTLLWNDNRTYLFPSMLKLLAARGVFRAAIITDDPFGEFRSGWRLTRRTMRDFDAHFVQREVNKSEFLAHGSHHIFDCDRSFDPDIHRPVTLSNEKTRYFHSTIGFIGSWAIHREETIHRLLMDGYDVTVWGPGWHKGRHWQSIKRVHRTTVTGEDYARTLNCIKIALHFLRKENRDDHDSRTFEIPACGAFMLAERSDKHLKYFAEGKEAEFFADYDELCAKLDYYLENDAARRRIGEAGCRRCRESDYSHAARIRGVLQDIIGLPKGSVCVELQALLAN